ncbi:MAG: hypothetical protein R3F20_11145 [Planctomycetota bacterium]
MIRALLTYFSLALVVQLGTGVLTKLVELVVLGDALSEHQFGEYQHYLLVLELASGAFYFGFDHSLVTFINKRKGNYRRFLRLFLAYALLLGALSGIAAFVASRLTGFSSTLAIGSVGLFVVAELGKLTFRARMEKALELTLLALQSMIWSVGCGLGVLLRDRPANLAPGEEWVPTSLALWWAFAGFAVVAALILAISAWRLSRSKDDLGPFRPFGPDYAALWDDYRHLWLAGAAFVVNLRLVQVIVDASLGREALGRYGYVMSMMMFIHRPLALVQRAALPLFTRHPDEVPRGFRQMVRLNLTLFPLVAIGMLGAFDLLLEYRSLSKYADTWDYLAVIVSASPMFTVEYLIATAAMARGLARNTKRANVAALFVNLPVTFALVLSLGLWGAALAAAAYPILFGILMLWFNRRDLPDFVAFASVAVARSLVWLGIGIGLLFRMEDRILGAFAAAGIYLAGTAATGMWPLGPFRDRA